MALAFGTNRQGTGDGGDTTIATDATLAVSSGDLLVALVCWTSTEPLNTVASPSNSFTRFPNSAAASGNDKVEAFYKENASAEAAATFTATFNGSATFRRIAVFQVTGAATTGAADKEEQATGASATSLSLVLPTLSQAAEIICAIKGSSGSALDWVPTDGGTHVNNGLGGDCDTWYEIVAGTGPHTVSIGGTQTEGTMWMTAVTFKEAGDTGTAKAGAGVIGP